MKKILSYRSLLLLFLVISFISCESEPLKGDFPQSEPNDAEEGQFIATIEGHDFTADEVHGTLNESNELSISGVKSGGETITLSIENAEVGTFNLTTTEINPNGGTYMDGSTFPYASVGPLGGSGQLKISELDLEDNTVTGTFSFKGVRIKIGEDGMPVMDGSGNPVIEEIEITNGAFNQIPFVNDGSGGGTGGGGGDPDIEFFAKVDGEDFITDSISVTEPVIGGVHMYKIEARTASRELIRIDIPRSSGEGTFDMESISDGTKLIGLYQERNGSVSLTSNPGTITITEFNLVEGVLKADFEFTGKDPLGQDPKVVQVTEGSFTIHFEGVPDADLLFRAKVDGAEFNPEDFTMTSSTVNQYPRVMLSAEIDGQEIEVSFPTTFLEGTYDFESEIDLGDEVVGSYTPEVGTSIKYVSESGVLAITNYDLETGIIEGTFNFTASDPSGQDPTVYQVTAGEFLIIL